MIYNASIVRANAHAALLARPMTPTASSALVSCVLASVKGVLSCSCRYGCNSIASSVAGRRN